MDDSVKTRLERSVRKQKYKQLLDVGAQLRMRVETADPVETFQGVRDIMTVSNALQDEGRVRDRAEGSTEVLLDAQVLKMSHELVYIATQQMGNADFSDEQLVMAILAMLDADQTSQNWEKITREAASIFHMTKHQQSLYGTFQPEPEAVSEKVVRQRAQRQKVDYGAAKKPETVEKLQKQEKSAQKLNVIYNRIIELVDGNGGAPIPYFLLILDPTDFMATVDNAFQLSFLIRDGRVALLSDANNDPLVRGVDEAEQKAAKKQTETTQAILGLNPKRWREMIERYQVVEPMLNMDREGLDASQSQRSQRDNSYAK